MKYIRKSIGKFILTLLFVAAAATALSGVYLYRSTPDSIRITKGETPAVVSAVYCTIESSEEENISVSAAGGASGTGGTYSAKLNLFGFIPIKDISITREEEKEVVISGKPFGIKLYTEGLLVIGTETIKNGKDSINPAEKCGIKTGDVISKINGTDVYTISKAAEIIKNNKGKDLQLEITSSDGKFREVSLTPVYSESSGTYKAGIWIRDSSAGIGTMTYIDESTSTFAGLGHGICDVSTGEIMPLKSGEIVDVVLTDVVKGASGVPGELQAYLSEHKLGSLLSNSVNGVYGSLNSSAASAASAFSSEYRYGVAMKQTVREGKAQILTTLPGDDTPRFYDISIEKINYNGNNPTKNMIIKVLDKNLLEKTGGIVQGMSGSPIVQNDKFVATATHVFVNDPTKGYAIFAENMVFADGTS
jgi:stage IV sporulation protein B